MTSVCRWWNEARITTPRARSRKRPQTTRKPAAIVPIDHVRTRTQLVMSSVRRQTTRITIDVTRLVAGSRDRVCAAQDRIASGILARPEALQQGRGAHAICTIAGFSLRVRATTCGSEWRRSFSITHCLRDQPPRRVPKVAAGRGSSTTSGLSNAENGGPVSPPLTDSLPPHLEEQRVSVWRRAAELLDTVLARATVAGHHINVYTGTDYTAIERLREDIDRQEQCVRKTAAIVKEAKSNRDHAHLKQASAQREIVSLLERKSSWTPTDLERYMLLVRSEHANEQDVQLARDHLLDTERELEHSRSLLEKLERKRYHEEQVWSDTIRRNSTWVTFGLMGVNILLLLAQIVVFEPYRRRKIVGDVETAISQRALATSPSTVDGLKVEDLPTERNTCDVETSSEAAVPDNTISPTAAVLEVAVPRADSEPHRSVLWLSTLRSYAASFRAEIDDSFSDRVVRKTNMEVTTIVLQSVLTGAACTALGFIAVLRLSQR